MKYTKEYWEKFAAMDTEEYLELVGKMGYEEAHRHDGNIIGLYGCYQDFLDQEGIEQGSEEERNYCYYTDPAEPEKVIVYKIDR